MAHIDEHIANIHRRGDYDTARALEILLKMIKAGGKADVVKKHS